MIGRIFLVLVACSASPAQAAPPLLRIGAQTIAAADIADARAYPEVGGDTAMLVTFEPGAAAKIDAAGAKPVVMTIDGGSTCPTLSYTPAPEGTLLLPCFKGRSADEVAAIAKLLSGKDPLPESLDDEP